MRGYFIFLFIVWFIFTGCKDNLKNKTRRVIESECKCFDSAEIILSPNVTRLFEEGVNANYHSYLLTYNSLTDKEKEELKKIIYTVYDSGYLNDCLTKARENISFSKAESNHLTSILTEAAKSNPQCRLVLYRVSDAIEAARISAECSRIIDLQCKCLNRAAMFLNDNEKKVLEQGAKVSNPFTNYLSQYDSLTDMEKNELKRFCDEVYDTAGEARQCINNIWKDEQNTLGDYMERMVRNRLFDATKSKPEWQLAFYLESLAILAAKNTIEWKNSK